MIVRKLSILVMLILIIMTSTVFANIPDSMDVETAKARSQETLLINSIEGTPYYVFIISDNAKYVSNYLFEKNGIFAGDFYPYLARVGDDTAFLQKGIGPFPTLDKDSDTLDGCFVITSNTGMPDILENISRASGGGGYLARFFAIKDNKIIEIQFMDQHRKIHRKYISMDAREKNGARYLDDGTFYLHTWTNAWPDMGTYKMVYMFDYKNLIMIRAYGYKKGPHDDDYHETDVTV